MPPPPRRRVAEKRLHRRALDQPPLVDEQHLVAEAPRLAEVVRRHDDLGARGVERLDHGLDLARRARIEARGRLVEKQHLRMQRPGAREREALLLAAREHARRPVREVGEPDLAQRLQRERLALGGAARARVPARRRCWRAPSGAASPGAGTPSPARGAPAPASGSFQRTAPDVGASRPCIRRISTLLPAPLAPRMMVRGPASIAGETPSMMVRPPGDERTSCSVSGRMRAAISRSAAARLP